MGISILGRAGRGDRHEKSGNIEGGSSASSDVERQAISKQKWSIGILAADTEEVPGSVLLMPKASEYNEPLGLDHPTANTSTSSLPSPYLTPSQRSYFTRRRPAHEEKKRTPDGAIILEPQPDDSMNDPLNWKVWRRDAALLSLGLYSLIGGGMTPVLAAGFNNVSADFDVGVPRVALTTGIYMAGLGVGCAFLSPTAILYGKRPVYLAAAICFIGTSIWCGSSPSFASLCAARFFQGVAVSSVECLPSASVAEIYFLHEKAYRLGIYTLLLLGGKNLVPLISAAIIESLSWRWVFYIVAMVVGFCTILLFLFVPETFWDRTPRPHRHNLSRKTSRMTLSRMGSFVTSPVATRRKTKHDHIDGEPLQAPEMGTLAGRRAEKRHAHFAEGDAQDETRKTVVPDAEGDAGDDKPLDEKATAVESMPSTTTTGNAEQRPGEPAPAQTDAIADAPGISEELAAGKPNQPASTDQGRPSPLPKLSPASPPAENHVHFPTPNTAHPYTSELRRQAPKSFTEQLRPYHGRINHDPWLKVFIRPFILYAYPSILWSTLVYSLSIGWLIVLSESVTTIYKSRNTYNFNSLQAGLVYLSPFIGGILGTAVAGKVSDIVVRAMSRRNDGVYEPEFRLVMAVPITISTVIGLMGYGWSVEEHDKWIVPTVFFGIISFGCSLGSTTSITFAVDSYRQFSGEALVTLNFSKNIFHGLVFSLFFNDWLQSQGSKKVFIAIGGIQLACLLTTIPMYIYGKRARAWSVRKDLMRFA